MKLHPRLNIEKFTDIPNIGKAMEHDFKLIGLKAPRELVGSDPYQLYEDLCRITEQNHDPCVIDVFIFAVRYMEGGQAKKWWEFTEERKKYYADERLEQT